MRTIKIDRSFVIDMLNTPEDEQIVRSIVQLGQGLNLHVGPRSESTGGR